jgi:hypothetical protein
MAGWCTALRHACGKEWHWDKHVLPGMLASAAAPGVSQRPHLLDYSRRTQRPPL